MFWERATTYSVFLGKGKNQEQTFKSLGSAVVNINIAETIAETEQPIIELEAYQLPVYYLILEYFPGEAAWVQAQLSPITDTTNFTFSLIISFFIELQSRYSITTSQMISFSTHVGGAIEKARAIQIDPSSFTSIMTSADLSSYTIDMTGASLDLSSTQLFVIAEFTRRYLSAVDTPGEIENVITLTMAPLTLGASDADQLAEELTRFRVVNFPTLFPTFYTNFYGIPREIPG